jgi:hypothetical protein
MKLPELALLAGIIIYIAFFTHPPPRFVSMVLENPIGQLLVLAGVVFVATKHALVALFLGIAFLMSSYPNYEYMDNPKKDKKDDKKDEKVPDMAQIGKLAQMLGGKNGKLPQEKGKDVKSPPPSTNTVKADSKTVEKFTPF